jgi:hypothetical protein
MQEPPTPSDPLQYLLIEEELPPDLAARPERNSMPRGVGVVGAVRWYEGTGEDRPAGQQPRLIVGALVTESAERAADVLYVTVIHVGDRGYTFQHFLQLIGDETWLGRKTAPLDGAEWEAVLVYFRIGAVNGFVEWQDYAGVPNSEWALEIAHLIAARVPGSGARPQAR